VSKSPSRETQKRSGHAPSALIINAMPPAANYNASDSSAKEGLRPSCAALGVSGRAMSNLRALGRNFQFLLSICGGEKPRDTALQRGTGTGLVRGKVLGDAPGWRAGAKLGQPEPTPALSRRERLWDAQCGHGWLPARVGVFPQSPGTCGDDRDTPSPPHLQHRFGRGGKI